jgi:hypothetical protein
MPPASPIERLRQIGERTACDNADLVARLGVDPKARAALRQQFAALSDDDFAALLAGDVDRPAVFRALLDAAGPVEVAGTAAALLLAALGKDGAS